jgi:hypothetical protein
MVGGPDDTARGLSIWLMPEAVPGARLQTLILDLARKNRTPSFPPHVTLLGGIAGPEDSVRAGAAMLARQMGPLTVHLGEIETSAAFFRCVFVRAELRPDLRWAEARGQKPFSEAAARPFPPHLSLVYGHLAAPAREAIREELGGVLKLSFAASCLHLFRTEGPPEAWQPRGVFPLQR